MLQSVSGLAFGGVERRQWLPHVVRLMGGGRASGRVFLPTASPGWHKGQARIIATEPGLGISGG